MDCGPYRGFPKEGDLRCDEYKAFIRRCACCWPDCGAPGPSDPHHVRRRGSGVTDDTTCIPLCRLHHDLLDHEPLGLEWESGMVTNFRARFLVEADLHELRAYVDAVQLRMTSIGTFPW